VFPHVIRALGNMIMYSDLALLLNNYPLLTWLLSICSNLFLPKQSIDFLQCKT